MEHEFSCIAMMKLFENCIGMTIESIGSLEVPLAFEILIRVAENVDVMSHEAGE